MPLFAASRMNQQLRNLLDNNQRAPPSLGDFLEFADRFINPPNAAAEAMLNASDPIFENVFDGVQLSAQPQGTKGTMKSGMNLVLEFQALVAEREAQYENLDQFFTALLQYAVHVDDLFDTNEEERKQACLELRACIYPSTREAIRITSFPTYVNAVCAAWSWSANGMVIPDTRHPTRYTDTDPIGSGVKCSQLACSLARPLAHTHRPYREWW